jgi:hypothetical protein
VNAYQNHQNVHDSGIQASTRNNLNYIANYKLDVPPETNLLAAIAVALPPPQSPRSLFGAVLSAIRGGQRAEHPVIISLRERLQIPYSMHGHTVTEIVDRLWLRISDFPLPTRTEVVQRFCDEVMDADKHCTNGFMVRMANVLIGFDENCVMQLRPSQIIQARISATMKRLRTTVGITTGEEPWTYWRDCVVQTWVDMEEVEMVDAERITWLTPLIDPMLPDLCIEPLAVKAEMATLNSELQKAAKESDTERLVELRVQLSTLCERRDTVVKEAIQTAGLDADGLYKIVYDAMIAEL